MPHTTPRTNDENNFSLMTTSEAESMQESRKASVLMTGTTKFQSLKGIKTVTIIGGAGFIGGWVTRHLAHMYQKSYNIACLDKIDTVASESNIASLCSLPNFQFVQGDITNMRDLTGALETYNIDCVMHFAASSHVQNSFSDPFSFTHNNVIGTHMLLEAMRSYGKIKRFVHVSTDEVYGETNGVFATETHRLGPTNPYSASKAAAEMYVNAYWKSFKIPTIIVRSNNVYRPCQYPEKIIPVLTSLAISGKRMTIQGTGNNTRRYLHGSDAADAFDTILHCGDVGETYNIDSRDEISNITVASLILEQFKRSLTGSIDWIPDRPFNDSEYRVDGSKLEALGWRQKVGFAQGLSETVEWYRKNMSTFWTKIEKSPCPSGVKEEKFLARKTPVGGMKARMGARRHSEVMVEE